MSWGPQGALQHSCQGPSPQRPWHVWSPGSRALGVQGSYPTAPTLLALLNTGLLCFLWV